VHPSAGADREDHLFDRSGESFQVRCGRLSPLQALAVARERRVWDRRADSWDRAGSAGLAEVVSAVLRECQVVPGAVAIDLGAGSGQVTLPLAKLSSRVLAVDVSRELLNRLQVKAARQSIENIEVLAQPIETLEVAPGSIDLIVSNYALHHLRDADKAQLVERTYRWLRPGGRVVIGDMMFGRTATAENRQIVAAKAAAFLRRGPSGWLRLVKNLARFALRISEKPLPPAAWEALARQAGFTAVSVSRVVSEACVLVAVKDDPSGIRPEGQSTSVRPASVRPAAEHGR
jgi:ubiquinone/menaquinone biosynthesis C-methylase UbiE